MIAVARMRTDTEEGTPANAFCSDSAVADLANSFCEKNEKNTTKKDEIAGKMSGCHLLFFCMPFCCFSLLRVYVVTCVGVCVRVRVRDEEEIELNKHTTESSEKLPFAA